MYIDFSISIPSNIPQYLKSDIEELEKIYHNNDNWLFDSYYEAVESTIKEAYGCGHISYQDAVNLFHRYGNMSI